MTQDALFTVGTLGFEERERAMLRDVLRISDYRTPTFRALVKDSGGFPHIIIVNTDKPDTLPRWEKFRRANEGKGHISAIMLGSAPPAQPWKYTLTRPTTFGSLFALLERVASEEHGYKPGAGGSNEQSLFVIAPEELTPRLSPAAATQAAAGVTEAQSSGAPNATVSAAPAATATNGSVASTTDGSAASTTSTPTPSAQAIASTPGTSPPIAASATSTSAPAAASTARAADSSNATATLLANMIGTQSAGAGDIAVLMEPPSSEPVNAPAASAATPNVSATDPTREMAKPARAAREPVRPRSGSGAQSRFLVVDDSLPVRIQMREALQKFARTIDFAHDGEQAMILIDNCKYDVIFLDVILPGKDGYDVCRYIRSHPLQRQTPVIMLTGNSAPADRVKGKLAGCDTYLIKPVRQSVLTEVIGEFIKSPAVA